MHSTTCLTITFSIAAFYIEKTMYHVYFLTRSGSVHCGSFNALGFGTNPFLTRLRSQKKNGVVFRPCSCARTGRGCPVRLRLSSLYSTPCAFRLTYSSPAPTMMWSRSWMPTMRPTSTSRSVTPMSSRDGCGSPLGC